MTNEPTYLKVTLSAHFDTHEEASAWVTKQTAEYTKNGFNLTQMSMYDYYRYDKKGLRIPDSKYVNVSVSFKKGTDKGEEYID